MEEFKLKDNHILRIDYDENSCINFEDINGDSVFLVYSHRNFTVEVEGFNPQEIYNYLHYREKPIFEKYRDNLSVENFNILLEEWEDNRPNDFSDYWIWTIYAYIHSGVSLSLTSGSDRWDTSSTGFLLILRSEYPDWKPAIDRAEEFIDFWNNCLSGNVYRFDLIKQEECGLCKYLHKEVINSCGGFIGNDEYDCGILGEIPLELIPEDISKLFVS